MTLSTAQRYEEMRKALERLANEVGGLNFRQAAIIEAIGMTNWDVLQLRLREAHRALAALQKDSP